MPRERHTRSNQSLTPRSRKLAVLSDRLSALAVSRSAPSGAGLAGSVCACLPSVSLLCCAGLSALDDRSWPLARAGSSLGRVAGASAGPGLLLQLLFGRRRGGAKSDMSGAWSITPQWWLESHGCMKL